MNKLIAIVAGEPNSINSEIIAKAWKLCKRKRKIFVIGNYLLLHGQINKIGIKIPLQKVNEIEEIKNMNKLCVLDVPLKFKSITPTEKYINNTTNPPEVIVEFFENIENIKLLNCYSNELNLWRKSEIEYLNNFKIKIKLMGKFTTERGRINCSLREPNGSWRWLGMQFVIAEL